ncbi:MAG: dihydrodipicolinate synthase family protein [Anaerolineales bacterium]|nr:dihydrodipicolinate synthase family protein [Anaerolineales bacterium]MCB9128534.1 dihydrodipicolinate synthase family protein [Ardenticatenales bacterium]
MTSSLHDRLKTAFVAAVTPMTANGDIDHEGLARNVAWFHELGLSLLLLGSTGEQVHLSEFERAVVLQVARRALPETGFLLAGTGLAGTRQTIGECIAAGRAGADAALVVTPNYYQKAMTAEALIAHYRAVADDSPIPILLYSVPAITGVTIPAEVVAALAAHPNVVGMKNSGADAALAAAYADASAGEAFVLLSGSPIAAPAFLQSGWTEGLILAAANVAPEASLALLRAAQAGDGTSLAEIASNLRRLVAEIGRYGIGGWKAGIEARGYAGGPPRLPLRPPSDEAREVIRAVVVREWIAANRSATVSGDPRVRGAGV